MNGMFSVACKNPLESEKVGDRRARKRREAENGSSASDTSSVGPPSLRTLEPVGDRFHLRSSASSKTSTLATSFHDWAKAHNRRTLVAGSDRPQSPSKSSFASIVNPWGSSSARDSPNTPNGTGSFTIQSGPHYDYTSAEMPHLDSVSTADRKGWNNVSESNNQTPRQPPSPSPPPAHAERGSTPHGHPSATVVVRDPSVRFHRLLRKIEKANDQTSCTRLGEEWTADDDDDKGMKNEFHFETALWALVRVQKLRTGGTGHDGAFLLTSSLEELEPENLEGAYILHLGSVNGSPESWYWGAKHSQAKIYSLGMQELDFDLSSSSWGVPPNVKSDIWTDPPRLQYVDNSFDLIVVSHDLFRQIKCTDWPTLISEISRVLLPDGLLVVSVMDALPQQAGPLLESWIRNNLVLSLLRSFMVPQPSLLLPSWIEENGVFCERAVERIEFPCYPALGCSGRTVRDEDHEEASEFLHAHSSTGSISRLNRIDEDSESIDEASNIPLNAQDLGVSRAGLCFYELLYNDFVLPKQKSTSQVGLHNNDPEIPRHWWWDDAAILDECFQFDPRFEMTTFVYQKIQ